MLHSGHFMRPASLHAVHRRTVNEFRTPFLLPEHWLQAMKRWPPHSEHEELESSC